MSLDAILPIIIVIAIVFLLVKVVSSIVRVILGIVGFFLVLYILQHYLNVDVSRFLGPLSKYINFGKIDLTPGGIFSLLSNLWDMALHSLENFKNLFSNIVK